MITPNFEIDQDNDFLTIKIELKYAKIQNAEFHIDGNQFMFYLKPYLLRLHFSHPLNEEGELNKSTYDLDKGLLTCRVQKLNPGDVFEDLDLITKLLKPK